jgi:surfactin family lipopeptide synthetase A
MTDTPAPYNFLKLLSSFPLFFKQQFMSFSILPLHPAQKDIYVDQLGSPQRPNYNVGGYVRLAGPLQVAGFLQAADAAAAQADVLRTRVDADSRQPVAYIAGQPSVPPTAQLDFSWHQAPPQAAQQWMQDRMDTPFALEKDQVLFEQYLLKIAGEEYLYYFRVHHLLYDGYCYRLWLNYIADMYRRLPEGTDTPAPMPSYTSAVLAANDYYHSAAYAAHARYWEERIPVKPAPLLQRRYNLADSEGKESSHHVITLAPGQCKALRELAATMGIRLPHVLTAAVIICFARMLQQEELVLGTPAHKRKGALRDVLGMFSGIVPFRTHYRPNMPLADMLQEIAAMQKADAAHADYLLGDLASRFKHTHANGPLLDIIVNYVLMDLNMDLGEHINTTFYPLVSRFQAEPLRITLLDYSISSALELHVDYRFGYFSTGDIELLVKRIVYILDQLPSLLQQPVKEVNIIPQEEVAMLRSFSGRTLDYPADTPVGSLFSLQAARTPQATALTYGAQSFSYAALETRSNRLAYYLAHAGMQKGKPVPVCLGRSADLVIAILAILKNGGIYVPLDPRYPQERIATMLGNMPASIAITNETFRHLLPQGWRVIDVEGLYDLLESLPDEKARIPLDAAQPAYIMFTSGSTGKPKGVAVSHRNISSLALGGDFTSFDSTDVLLSTGSPSFDATTIEYWGTLLNGGHLVMCDEPTLLDASLLKQAITGHGVTKMWFTASWLHQLVDHDISIFETLSVVIAGGEKLSEKHISQLRNTYPSLQIINGYGPTENTTFSLTYQVTENTFNGSIPIGRPLANRTAFILDAHQRLLPIGAIGELYVGGAGLSSGYFAQPALTGARFILYEGMRLYRTGDRACWLPDGNVVYLGRLDDQVKIRGHRIEPGEIEQVLLASKMAEQAVVLARPGNDGQLRLVAYIVPAAGYNSAALETYLSDHLPEYMLPAALVTMDALPLTHNGKVDKSALPETGMAAAAATTHEAPRNETESQLAAIWEEALHIDGIGIHDDFFRLGGDSIIAIGVTSRMRKTFDRNIKLYDLYQAPTIAQLAALVAGAPPMDLRPRNEREALQQEFAALKAELLPQLKHPALVEDIFPMSDIQGGMVSASLLNPELAIYHDQLAYTFPADLDIPLFEQAFSLLVQQHAILRTAFDLEIHPGGVQVVYRTVPVSFERPQLQLKERKDIQAFLAQERKRPFDIGQAPLWRGALIALEDGYVFILQFHHAIADGWSMASFNTALSNLYARLRRGESITALPPLKSSYKDYVIEMMIGKRNSEAARFWKNEMAAYKRLDIFTSEADDQQLIKTYNPEYLQQLKEKATAAQLSVKAVLLGAYLYTLSMLSAEDELTVGLVTNNRPLTEDGDKVLGCFLNSVPYRCHTRHGANTWKNWFEQVERQLSRLKQHDQTSLLDIRKMADDVTPAENAFFDVLFNFVNFHVYGQQEQGLYKKDMSALNDSESLDTGFEAVNTYLNCIASITGDVLVIIHSCRRQLQCGITLEGLHAYYHAVLEQFLHHYEQPVNRASVLAAVPERVPPMPSGPAVDYPSGATIDAIFAAQAALTPDAPALSGEQQTLTYSELDILSGQLAHYLHKAGVKPGHLVPVCLERSTELLVVILGIIKAGAAYVPVDTAYPPARIAYILEDIAGPLAITNSEYRHLFPDNAAVINLDGIGSILEWQPYDPLITGTGPDSIAYIMYTSGSTGRPKGVMVTHRNISSLVMGGGFVTFTDQDRLLATGSPSFDATTLEYWGMLLNGGHLIVQSEKRLLDIGLLKQDMQQYRVTKMFFTAGWLNQLVDNDISIFEGVGVVMTGGEKLSERHIEKLRKAFPEMTLINCYGPTENATVSLAYNIRELAFAAAVPIGRPLANRAAYILDACRQLLPVGVPGELYVGGHGLAAGYLHREELTAGYFMATPYGRLYRTGDKACWLQDGNAAYLGRLDDQVKIRGHRIEPGEIEQAIMASGMVKQVVVAVRKDRHGIGKLLAYLVTDAGYSDAALTTYLQARLPEYMVPAFLIGMERLPLTANGKIDRAALPDPGAVITTASRHELPRNQTERLIAAIWRQSIHTEEISIHDDFFRLGGDSITAIGVISRIRGQIDDRVRLYDLYQHPTIAKLAQLIDRLPASSPDVTTVQASVEEQLLELRSRMLALLPGAENITDVFPMSDIQRGMVYTSLLEPELSIYHDQFVYPFPLALDIDLFRKAFALLVEKHGILRTAFDLDYEDGIQVVYRSVPVNIQYIDRSQLDNTTGADFIQTFLESERQRPINLSQAPVWRATIVRLQQRHVFLLQFHHAIMDGWSLAAFTRELNNIYMAMLEGIAFDQPLALLKCTYRDFVIQMLSDKQQKEHQLWWQQELAGYKRLKLFTSAETHNKLVHVYDNSTWNALKQRCLQDGLSHKAVFLGISLYVLGMLTGEDEITVGIITNNRPVVEDGEKLLGCFLNTLPFRQNKVNGRSWQQYLENIDQRLHAVKERENISLADIARLAGEKAEEQNPFTDVIFNFTNFHLYTDMAAGLFSAMMEEEGWDVSKATGYDHVNTYLDINVSITGDMLVMIYGQRKQLACGKTLAELHSYFDAALHAYLATPAALTDTKALLPATEQQQLLHWSNQVNVPYPSHQTLAGLFHEQALRTPNATSLTFEDISLTYEELEQRSNQLGNYLREQGISRGSMVLLFADRGIGMITGILGILKAGGAYVPVDPSYPADHIRYVMQDTGAVHMLCSSANNVIPDAGNCKVIDLQAQAAHISRYAVTLPAPLAEPDDPAYVIYTSGSTGRPKGVMVQHSAVVNLVADRSRAFEITSSDNVLQVAQYTFDASVEQIFLALLNGAALHLLRQDNLLDADAFYHILKEKNITHLHATPSFLSGVLPLPAGLPLRNLVAGGEACPASLATQCAGEVRFYNEYGPTETTVTATCYRYNPHDALTGACLPIGRPLDNVRIYLLDKTGQLLPFGVTGEICIAGAGVSKGYLGKPDLTEARFVPDPFSTEPGARMYRTGDKGRWLENGQLEFTGRMDEQLKLRGYRIEPGEIEHTLLRSGQVLQAAVKLHTDHQLAAYVQLLPDANAEDLAAWLRTQLPAYMQPAWIIPMDSLPLTASGKVDRQALPEPGNTGNRESGPLPSDPVQRFVAAVWQDLLGIPEVHIAQDFFELGGHSLLLLQMLSRIRKKGYAVQLNDLYANRTIAALAACLEEKGVVAHAGAPDHILLLRQGDGPAPVFIIPGSDGVSDGYDELAAALDKQYTVYGIQMWGMFEGEQPLENVAAIAAQQLAWIKTMQPTGPYRLLGHSFGAYVAYETARLLEQQGERVESLWLLDAPCPYVPGMEGEEERKRLLWEAVLQLLERQQLVSKPYPGWLHELGAAARGLKSTAVIPFTAKALAPYAGRRMEHIAYQLRMLNLRLINAGMHYTPGGELKTPFVVAKAVIQRWQMEGPALGWADYAQHVKEIMCPGDHFSMVKGENAKALALMINSNLMVPSAI